VRDSVEPVEIPAVIRIFAERYGAQEDAASCYSYVGTRSRWRVYPSTINDPKPLPVFVKDDAVLRTAAPPCYFLLGCLKGGLFRRIDRSTEIRRYAALGDACPEVCARAFDFSAPAYDLAGLIPALEDFDSRPRRFHRAKLRTKRAQNPPCQNANSHFRINSMACVEGSHPGGAQPGMSLAKLQPGHIPRHERLRRKEPVLCQPSTSSSLHA
jgi:hypothetical protein